MSAQGLHHARPGPHQEHAEPVVQQVSIEWSPRASKVVEARPYTGKTESLNAGDTAFFKDKYELPTKIVQEYIAVDPQSDRYVLPFFGPQWHTLRGHVLRVPWEGSPRRVIDIPRVWPKADTYKIKPNDPLLAWYAPIYPPAAGAVLVEDQLSAIKLISLGINAVALLGKPVSGKGDYTGFDRVQELARYAPTLIVALDADATTDAFKFAQKWGSAFKSIRVAILTADIKDTPAADIHEVLGI